MKRKIFFIFLLISSLVVSFIPLDATSCCDIGKKCCCEKQPGWVLFAWGCACSGDTVVKSCEYVPGVPQE